MRYARLGSGLEVSRIALGCMTYGDPAWRPWILDEAEAREHFRRAVDLGINFFDTADMYSRGRSEEVTGRLLRELLPRESYVLATKVYFSVADGSNRRGLSRKHVLAACDASLARLGLDYIDLYQIHRWDEGTPIEETLDALDSLVRAGKVRYLGASSMAAWQFAKSLFTADRLGKTRFVAMQAHHNLVYREEEREMIPLCRDQGVGVVAWSPLARGFLSGARTRDTPRPTTRARTDGFADEMYYADGDWRVLDTLIDLAAQRRVSPARMALAWSLSVPGLTVALVGASKLEQIEDAAHATEIELTAAEIEKLEARYVVHAVRGHTQPSPRARG